VPFLLVKGDILLSGRKSVVIAFQNITFSRFPEEGFYTLAQLSPAAKEWAQARSVKTATLAFGEPKRP